MITPDGLKDELGQDITAAYLRGEVVQPYHLYDIHYDPRQPPYLLTNRRGGARIALRHGDGSLEHRRYMEWSIEHGDVSVSTSGELPENDLRLADGSGLVKTLFRGKDLNGCRVYIRKAYEGQTEVQALGQLCTEYRIDGYRIQGHTGIINLSSGPDLLGAEIGRRAYRTCSWQFKGPECRYRGDAERCDHTLAACQALGNQRRYGGWPGILRGNQSSI